MWCKSWKSLFTLSKKRLIYFTAKRWIICWHVVMYWPEQLWNMGKDHIDPVEFPQYAYCYLYYFLKKLYIVHVSCSYAYSCIRLILFCMQWLFILHLFTVLNVRGLWSVITSILPCYLQVIVSLAGMNKIISFDNVSPRSFIWIQYIAFCHVLINLFFKCIQGLQESLNNFW